jgi:hypothetical protein
MTLKPDHAPYVPAAGTNVLATFRRLGWTPPSEDPKTQEKWQYYKSLSQLSEEALHEAQPTT